MIPLRVSPMLWVPLIGPARLLLPDHLWSTLDATQQDAILAHELAHWKRGDHWVRRLELLVLALYWWNPIAWFARRQLERAEEQCCDAIVLQALPSAAQPYAEALVSTAIFLSGLERRLPLGISAAGRTLPLKRRLNMILSDRPIRPTPIRVAAALLAAGILGLPFLPGPASGQSAPIKPPPTPAPTISNPPAAPTIPTAAAAPRTLAQTTTSSTPSVGPNPRKTRVAHPIQRELRDYEIRPGTVEPSRRFDLRAQVSGKLIKANVQPGQLVKEGEVLFQIDPARYQIAFDRAQAEVRQARSRAQAKRTAQHQVDRTPEGTVRDRDKAEIYRIEAEEAEAAVQSAQASSDLAALELEATNVKAPIAGRFTGTIPPLGGNVTADTTLLGTLVVLDPVHVIFKTGQAPIIEFNRRRREGAFKDSDQPRLPVKISFQGENNFAYEGTAELIEMQPSSDFFNARWRVTIPNAGNVFLPHMRVDVKSDTTAPYRALLIHERSLINEGMTRVIDHNDKIVLRNIKLGSQFGELRDVKTGLKPDDWVVVDPDLGGWGNAGTKIIPDQVPMPTELPPPEPSQLQ